MSYRLIRPLLFALDPERAHNLSIAALRMTPTAHPLPADPMLESQVAGLRFPNPVGLAAGYDKDGRVAHKMHSLGFGFAELGTLTPLAQPGNPQPRLFRLVEDRAVINRFGFNNGGQGAAADRIARYRRPKGEGPVIGINIGANKDATAAGRGIADYVTGVTCMMPLADYLTVNISSPNTPGLRALQDRAALDDLLGAVMAAFAGVLADPVQARLGLHQRRLRRLIRAMAAEVAAGQGRGFAAHEHALARVMDVWDAVTSLLRALRG